MGGGREDAGSSPVDQTQYDTLLGNPFKRGYRRNTFHNNGADNNTP